VSVSDAKLLAQANPAARLVLVEGMNHVLKDAPADRIGNVAAYTDPTVPLSARVVEEMAGLIGGLKGRNAAQDERAARRSIGNGPKEADWTIGRRLDNLPHAAYRAEVSFGVDR
jgi:hypothetical protein